MIAVAMTVADEGRTPSTDGPQASDPAVADFRFLPAIPAAQASRPPARSPTLPPSGPPAAAHPIGTIRVGIAGADDAAGRASIGVSWDVAKGAPSSTLSGGTTTGSLERLRTTSAAGRIVRSASVGRAYQYEIAPAKPSAGWGPGDAGVRLTSLDDRDGSVSYTGAWASAGYPGYLHGGARYSKTAGDTAQLTFSGWSIAVVGPMGPGRGSAGVSIDGSAATTVSQRAATFSPRHVLFVRSWPTPGRHTLTIRVERGIVALDSFLVAESVKVSPRATSPEPPSKSPSPTPGSTPASLSFPIRAAFYYGWYPEAWPQHAVNAFTNYHPTAGTYDTGDPAIVANQIRAMQYGGIEAGLASWWGIGTRTDGRMAELLAAAHGGAFHWAVNDELEEVRDPAPTEVTRTLEYIRDQYAADPSYLRVKGRFVVVVGAGPTDGCDMVDRWVGANRTKAYLVLPTFDGYASCRSQPDDWYTADPTSSDLVVGTSSYTISAGFWRPGESPRLTRDLDRWSQSVAAMAASGAHFQLIQSFNQWGDGSSVESATEWASSSGFGSYLDVLHANGARPAPSGASNAAVLVAAGNIAGCRTTRDQTTADLVATTPGTVVTLGDAAGDAGTVDEYRTCYEPSWGAFRNRTRPTPGTRDYRTAGAAGYFSYFGAAAGRPGAGWYAYDLGSWRIYALNSNCDSVGGCGRNSPQERWLRADLAAHPHDCVGAYWQIARFSSGRYTDDSRTGALWDDLYRAGAEFVLNAHDHNYQRYAPQSPNGTADPDRGIREFIVGTGGNGHTDLRPEGRNREVGNDVAYGVLKLTLGESGYEWQFLSTPREPFTDSGAESCH